MKRRLSVLCLAAVLAWSAAVLAYNTAPVQPTGPPTGATPAARSTRRWTRSRADNVQRLAVAWRWDSPDNAVVSANRGRLPAFPASFKSTPIMVNGVLYIKTSLSQAAAIDAATGKALWTFDPEMWQRHRPANTGFNSRGVAYWSDGKSARIFLPTGDAYLWVARRTHRPAGRRVRDQRRGRRARRASAATCRATNTS